MVRLAMGPLFGLPWGIQRARGQSSRQSRERLMLRVLTLGGRQDLPPFLPLGLLLTTLLGTVLAKPTAALADDLLIPVIEGPWTPIAGNPDLGDYTSENQQPVDFGVWQASDGTWQAWSCIRGTKCGGHTRLFYRWEGKRLTDADWMPMGIAMEADPQVGEAVGGLQAPHVVRVGDQFHMFYGDWNNICHAVSSDGKHFQRVIQPSGTTAMFAEQGSGTNTRDVMMLNVNGLWHGYYTAYPHDQGAVFARTTSDFSTWSDSTVVAFGGVVGTGRYASECPHVVSRHGRFYLFRTQRYGEANVSTVYHSSDPLMFGINQDDRYRATQLPVAAPEVVQYQGQDYIVALNRGLDGLRIAKLSWRRIPKVGRAVLPFDDPLYRQTWQQEQGNLPGPFTNSKRSEFAAPQEYFVGTAELDARQFDDSRTGVIHSPEFMLSESEYFVYLSGGANGSQLYLAFIDSQTGNEIIRVTNRADSNQLTPQLVAFPDQIGRRVFVRIVDQASEGWGHLNFGGLYSAD